MVLRLVLLAILFILIVAVLLGRSTLLSFRRGQRLSAGQRAASQLMKSGKDPAKFIEAIPKYAQEHVARIESVFGEKLSYRKSDLARLDRLITKAWDDQVPKSMDGLVLTFGAYFGETVRRRLGGQWDYDREKGFCLRQVGGVATVYPFDKVRKRFENGSRDSLGVFYKALCLKLGEASV